MVRHIQGLSLELQGGEVSVWHRSCKEAFMNTHLGISAASWLYGSWASLPVAGMMRQRRGGYEAAPPNCWEGCRRIFVLCALCLELFCLGFSIFVDFILVICHCGESCSEIFFSHNSSSLPLTLISEDDLRQCLRALMRTINDPSGTDMEPCWIMFSSLVSYHSDRTTLFHCQPLPPTKEISSGNN